MTPLEGLLRQRIAAEGALPVAQFMAAVLGHPEHGVYMQRDPLGQSGDFVTAPEISQVFGELIGAWCAAVWQMMGAPDPLPLVELGPGRGTLLADVWRTLNAVAKPMAAALRLHLVESSPPLRTRQQATLAGLSPSVAATWHARADEGLAALPDGPFILLANEFFDALPIQQFVRCEGAWHERLIDVAPGGEGLSFVLGPAADPPVELSFAASARDGDILELCPEAERLAGHIAARLAAPASGCGSAALIVDYGPARSGFGDTLQAVGGHRIVDPLTAPGEADLSHHVDFERLRAAAERAGARCFGPIAQGLFLCRLGAGVRADALAARAPSVEAADAIRGAVRRLVHPGRMGLLFKALAITAPGMLSPPGFDPPAARRSAK